MRVVLAEDLHILRDGLALLLETHGFTIVASVADGPSLRDALARHRPDVAVVDVRLPPTQTDEGLQIALEARGARPGLPVLVLSAHVEQLYARELLADGAGAVGYLLKDRVLNGDQFADAVRRVANGGTVMDPQVIAKLLNSGGPGSPLTALTPREREVLELMAQGRSNAAIGQRLFLSDSAVSKNIAAIFGKLGLSQSDDDNRRVMAVLAFLNAGT
ncbi:DNA-binding response regulator [Actinoplanes italicus]|uniref:LuxR family two component transcriptional regulator n=1 Tax=Actinoplanes italicus TaxID=113567 RepID=A0A2T0K1M8_9ACTN|nr:response regulator transcription factor [Actinoplanes italicus]PRX16715.1 LuxR family two component transcriptional regulator [Actinoplanes italicus]GIE31153.1 DNA-binding response regulator [Actinoplanes italicus]